MGTPLPPPPPPPFVYSALPLPASVLSPPSCTATSLVFSGSIDGLICIKMDVFFVCLFVFGGYYSFFSLILRMDVFFVCLFFFGGYYSFFSLILRMTGQKYL